MDCILQNVEANLAVTFDLGSVRMFSTVIFMTYFSYHKDTYMDCWYGLLFDSEVLPESVISFDSYITNFTFDNFYFKFLLINTVTLLLNCLVLVSCLYIHFLCLCIISPTPLHNLCCFESLQILVLITSYIQ